MFWDIPSRRPATSCRRPFRPSRRRCTAAGNTFANSPTHPKRAPPPFWRSRNARASPPMSTASMPTILTLADEIRLEVVNKLRLSGRTEVSKYFTNYAKVSDWHLIPGFVDRRPGILVRDLADPNGRPTYFILLSWGGDGLIGIRDFRYARYAIEGAELVALR